MRLLVAPRLAFARQLLLAALATVGPASLPTAGQTAGTAAHAAARSPILTRDADGRPIVRATRVDRPMTIDGRLDEDVYRLVPALTEFVQQEPVERRADL